MIKMDILSLFKTLFITLPGIDPSKWSGVRHQMQYEWLSRGESFSLQSTDWQYLKECPPRVELVADIIVVQLHRIHNHPRPAAKVVRGHWH